MVQKMKTFYQIITGFIASLFVLTPQASAKAKDVKKPNDAQKKAIAETFDNVKYQEKIGDLAREDTAPAIHGDEEIETMRFVVSKEKGRTHFQRIPKTEDEGRLMTMPSPRIIVDVDFPARLGEIEIRTSLENVEDGAFVRDANSNLYMVIPVFDEKGKKR